jgi:hypothetical protein
MNFWKVCFLAAATSWSYGIEAEGVQNGSTHTYTHTVFVFQHMYVTDPNSLIGRFKGKVYHGIPTVFLLKMMIFHNYVK